MCEFFSCVSNGKGKLLYFNAEQRAALRQSNPKNYEPDSHTSIADFYGYVGAKEDTLNKYEFNPLTKKFTIDQINTKDDSASIERKLLKLDFKTIVPELVIKPIVHPFKIERHGNVTDHELELLNQWASVWASVWDSVWAYQSSFFQLDEWKCIKHERGQNPYQPCIDLWNVGLVPSFDGKTWRLHAGEKAEIVWEGKLRED